MKQRQFLSHTFSETIDICDWETRENIWDKFEKIGDLDGDHEADMKQKHLYRLTDVGMIDAQPVSFVGLGLVDE